MRSYITKLCSSKAIRLTEILRHINVGVSSWYYQAVNEKDRKRPGPKAIPVDPDKERLIIKTADLYPQWGYRKIAIVCRRTDSRIRDREVYKVFKAFNLLQKPKPRAAELHQASKLYELLPQKPNDLWQMDVTYIHIPGHGWWYAVTVIDYYSRYLLSDYLCDSYSSVSAIAALAKARERAEDIYGPLQKLPFLVTDNGSCFISRKFRRFISGRYTQVRIQYRTPTQLGLLERFHKTLKTEEVYWNLYDNPQEAREGLRAFRHKYNEVRPHWALKPEGDGDALTPEAVYTNGLLIEIPKWQGWAKGAKEKLEKLMREEVNDKVA
jgi:transposase InsO family protein